MTPAALIAGLRRMEEDLASLRAQVATLTAAPATTTEPGLDLDARVPCASCGGEFVWRESPSDRGGPRYYDGRCRCGAEWCDIPAPVTWRTLTAYSNMEVPAAYVARLVSEVDRLRALLTASAPSSTAAPHSGAEPTVEAGAFAGRRACWDCRHDSNGNGRGLCLRQRGVTYSVEVSDWIVNNYDREPKPWARNCPGWAPKSGEVSNG